MRRNMEHLKYNIYIFIITNLVYIFNAIIKTGKWSAICYTIMESCRLQKIDPRKYMEIVTERLLIDRAYNKKPDYTHLTPLSLANEIRKMDSNFRRKNSVK